MPVKVCESDGLETSKMGWKVQYILWIAVYAIQIENSGI